MPSSKKAELKKYLSNSDTKKIAGILTLKKFIHNEYTLKFLFEFVTNFELAVQDVGLDRRSDLDDTNFELTKFMYFLNQIQSNTSEYATDAQKQLNLCREIYGAIILNSAIESAGTIHSNTKSTVCSIYKEVSIKHRDISPSTILNIISKPTDGSLYSLTFSKASFLEKVTGNTKKYMPAHIKRLTLIRDLLMSPLCGRSLRHMLIHAFGTSSEATKRTTDKAKEFFSNILTIFNAYQEACKHKTDKDFKAIEMDVKVFFKVIETQNISRGDLYNSLDGVRTARQLSIVAKKNIVKLKGKLLDFNKRIKLASKRRKAKIDETTLDIHRKIASAKSKITKLQDYAKENENFGFDFTGLQAKLNSFEAEIASITSSSENSDRHLNSLREYKLTAIKLFNEIRRAADIKVNSHRFHSRFNKSVEKRNNWLKDAVGFTQFSSVLGLELAFNQRDVFKVKTKEAQIQYILANINTNSIHAEDESKKIVNKKVEIQDSSEMQATDTTTLRLLEILRSGFHSGSIFDDALKILTDENVNSEILDVFNYHFRQITADQCSEGFRQLDFHQINDLTKILMQISTVTAAIQLYEKESIAQGLPIDKSFRKEFAAIISGLNFKSNSLAHLAEAVNNRVNKFNILSKLQKLVNNKLAPACYAVVDTSSLRAVEIKLPQESVSEKNKEALLKHQEQINRTKSRERGFKWFIKNSRVGFLNRALNIVSDDSSKLLKTCNWYLPEINDHSDQNKINTTLRDLARTAFASNKYKLQFFLESIDKFGRQETNTSCDYDMKVIKRTTNLYVELATLASRALELDTQLKINEMKKAGTYSLDKENELTLEEIKGENWKLAEQVLSSLTVYSDPTRVAKTLIEQEERALKGSKASALPYSERYKNAVREMHKNKHRYRREILRGYISSSFNQAGKTIKSFKIWYIASFLIWASTYFFRNSINSVFDFLINTQKQITSPEIAGVVNFYIACSAITYVFISILSLDKIKVSADNSNTLQTIAKKFLQDTINFYKNLLNLFADTAKSVWFFSNILGSEETNINNSEAEEFSFKSMVVLILTHLLALTVTIAPPIVSAISGILLVNHTTAFISLGLVSCLPTSLLTTVNLLALPLMNIVNAPLGFLVFNIQQAASLEGLKSLATYVASSVITAARSYTENGIGIHLLALIATPFTFTLIAKILKAEVETAEQDKKATEEYVTPSMSRILFQGPSEVLDNLSGNKKTYTPFSALSTAKAGFNTLRVNEDMPSSGPYNKL